jgi:hypothetical protein
VRVALQRMVLNGPHTIESHPFRVHRLLEAIVNQLLFSLAGRIGELSFKNHGELHDPPPNLVSRNDIMFTHQWYIGLMIYRIQVAQPFAMTYGHSCAQLRPVTPLIFTASRGSSRSMTLSIGCHRLAMRSAITR